MNRVSLSRMLIIIIDYTVRPRVGATWSYRAILSFWSFHSNQTEKIDFCMKDAGCKMRNLIFLFCLVVFILVSNLNISSKYTLNLFIFMFIFGVHIYFPFVFTYKCNKELTGFLFPLSAYHALPLQYHK